MNNINKKKIYIKHNAVLKGEKDLIKKAILEAYEEIEGIKREKHIPTEFLKIPLDIIFLLLGFILGSFSLVFIFIPFYQGLISTSIALSVFSFSIGIICGIFTYVCYKTRKEIEKETDKNYLAAFFSAIVSFVALIISLIGLYKTY